MNFHKLMITYITNEITEIWHLIAVVYCDFHWVKYKSQIVNTLYCVVLLLVLNWTLSSFEYVWHSLSFSCSSIGLYRRHLLNITDKKFIVSFILCTRDALCMASRSCKEFATKYLTQIEVHSLVLKMQLKKWADLNSR